MTFHQILTSRLKNPTSGPEPLAALPYEQELALKRAAMEEFWKANRLQGSPEAVRGAPQPRGYRSTCKRRVRWLGSGQLAMGHLPGRRPGLTPPSPLETASHAAGFQYCYTALSRKGDQSLARALNWIVLRGGEAGRVVVFVVDRLDGAIVRQARKLAEGLAGMGFGSAMLYVDPSRSDYYLEAERPETGLSTKHLFGPKLLTLRFADGEEDVRLKYPLTSFSQINEAMVPELVAVARELLALQKDDRLLDLYCGYGLFTFTLGKSCREAFGVELAGDSIEAAIETARRQGQGSRLRFLAGRIDKEHIGKLLPRPSADSEVILLDPPRQGPLPGVITALAARRPRRVLHIACGTDELVPSLAAWNSAGYRVERVVPLDLFPGTINLETLVLLVPGKE